MGEVDPAFIQAPEHRPKLTVTEAEGVPVIDLSSLSGDDLVAEIGRACEEWGFFQVVNHGVAAETREKLDSVARKFFALTTEEKRKVRRDEENPLGYYDTELTKNVRDWKEVFDFTVSNPTVIPASHEPDDQTVRELVNQWPQFPPELRYYNYVLIFLTKKKTINIKRIRVTWYKLINRLGSFEELQNTNGVVRQARVQHSHL